MPNSSTIPAKSDAATTLGDLLFELATSAGTTGYVALNKLGYGVDASFTLVSVTNGFPVQPATGSTWTISGSITANAGSNLNTSLLALEAGGNLATLAGIVTSSRAAVNPISGQAGVAGGSGTVSALTQRVCLATDVPLPAGTNVLGHVVVDSGTVTTVSTVTTVTTVAAVTAITNALPAGSNTIGDVTLSSETTAALTTGRKSSIGTSAVQLTTTSVVCKRGVVVKAANGNGTGVLYVGPSTVTADSADATDGFELGAGESCMLPVANVNTVYAIGSTTGLKAFWAAA